MASTYTPPQGGNGQVWFQDCELSPATLASGDLRKRFDLVQFPRLGVMGDPVIGAASITIVVSPAHPAAADDVTITVTVASGVQDVVPSSTVNIFSDGSALQDGVVLNGQGVGTFDAGQLAAGSYTITAEYAGDDQVPYMQAAPYALTVTA